MSVPLPSTFDAWAGDYARYRPGYPVHLFDQIAEVLGVPAGARVADIGAGTGLATFAMAERGWRMTAVEPGPKMLDELRRQAADTGVAIDVVEAPAERTGLPDASFDLVTAAQAFHWFDRRRALDEAARILRPGGGVALFWNVRRPEASPVVADYEAVMSRHFGEAGIGQYLQFGPEAEEAAIRQAFADSGAFDGLAYGELRHETTTDADGVVGMAFTASYVRRLPADERDRLEAELRAIVDRHGLGGERFPIPYRIDLWTARRRTSASRKTDD